MKNEAILSATLLSAFVGCGVEPPPSDPSAEDPAVAAHTSAVVTARSDFRAAVPVPGGQWGSPTQLLFCNEGSYAAGFLQRVEPYQGNGDDDTGLNSVALICRNRFGSYIETLTVHPGYWGSWGATRSCAGANNFLTSARLKVESPQGSGDDTSADDSEFSCEVGGATGPTGNGAPWGSWQNWSSCPPGSAICGLTLQIESPQGGGDDTAMNAMTLYCCNR